MLSKFFLAFSVLVLLSCSESVSENFDKRELSEVMSFDLNWIEGSWIDSTVFNGRSFFVENWVKENEDAFVGEKFQIVKSDSSKPTSLSVTKTDGKFYYSYFEAEEQTTFVQDSIGESYISFRNTTDKFPERLAYHRTMDTLRIGFSGMTNGIFRSSYFTTIKVK